ncbi:CbtA family protein [Granulicella mallensis]|uniref:Putative cobalt transporter CbtA n=1 Tax=Granulicella mallensis TaxID=940614 RepID=A0A7W7ZQW0_9BACT|nr:CbtA family protein [Granulicella mallensis]MBB5064449.1 putative cobalt transporter CbtA [Granulicella mallensis]
MARTLLLRGMLVGLVAGLIVFAFARWIGEPQVDRAIAFETSMDQAKGEAPEPEMVSRKIQSGLGLLTGAVVYSTALGGIFGIVFAFARGRLSAARPRALSALIAGLGFIAIVLVPSLKYPANPPSVGNPETIGVRTGAYFLLIAISLMSLILAIKAGRRLKKPFGPWNASLLAALLFVLLTGISAHFMPVIDEVPAGFPASLLWKFRIASWETQVVLWSVLGLLFGALTERQEAAAQQSGRAFPTSDEMRYS